jgi:hypothetical protein
MTIDDRIADIHAKLAEVGALLDRMKAEEPERERLRIKTRVAMERQHQAVQALREARP